MKQLLFYFTIIISLFACHIDQKQKNFQFENEIKSIQENKNLELTSHIYIKGKINDTIDGIFLFDTGANGLILDKTFLSKNQLTSNISKEAHYAYGVGENKTKFQSTSDISLEINNKTFKDLELRVMPLDSIFSKVLNHKIDGIIGADIFNDHLLKIDFDKATFELLDSISVKDMELYTRLQYNSNYRKPIVLAAIDINTESSINCHLIFDTGSGRGISLTHKKGIEENLFFEHIACEEDSVSGMGGISTSCYLPIKQVELSNIQIKADTIEIGKDKKGALGLHDMYDGLLGMRIIEKFNLIIDNNSEVIWFKQR